MVWFIMKNLLVVIMLVLCFGFSSAHDVWYKEKYSESRYFPEDSVVVSRTVWADYKNVDRFSTYDYRHGYSYRATKDYFERIHDFGRVRIVKIRRDIVVDDDFGIYGDEDFDYGKAIVRHEYVPYLKNYEKKKCYVRPPKNKLFYIKC